MSNPDQDPILLTPPPTPPPGWQFCIGSTTYCLPSRDLVELIVQIFDVARLVDQDDDLLSTPVTLERAQRIHAELLSVLQPRQSNQGE